MVGGLVFVRPIEYAYIAPGCLPNHKIDMVLQSLRAHRRCRAGPVRRQDLAPPNGTQATCDAFTCHEAICVAVGDGIGRGGRVQVGLQHQQPAHHQRRLCRSRRSRFPPPKERPGI